MGGKESGGVELKRYTEDEERLREIREKEKGKDK